MLYNQKNLPSRTEALAANGTVSWPEGNEKYVVITKGTAAAVTLSAPVSGHDDYKVIHFVSTTAAAHTVTCSTIGFNAGDAAKDVGTFGAAIGNGFTCIAYGGEVYTLGVINVTFA